MKSAFFKTSIERQKSLVSSAVEEFSNYNYESASINRIIKNAGISKGGLFKYIDGKEDLYLYVVELAIQSFVSYQYKHCDRQSGCYVDRIYSLMAQSLPYMKVKGDLYKLILKVSFDLSSPQLEAVRVIRRRILIQEASGFEAGIDWSQYQVNADRVKDHVSIFINGFNLKLLQVMATEFYEDQLEDLLEQELKCHLGLIKQTLKGGHNEI